MFIGVYGYLWMFMGVYGFVWVSMGAFEFLVCLLVPMGVYGGRRCSWVFGGAYGCI